MSTNSTMSTAKNLESSAAPAAAPAAAAPPVGAVANDAPAAAKKRSGRPYAILGGIVAVALSAYIGFRVAVAGRESTDDAQVAADVVPLASRVAGMVVELPVTDNQPVKKGDLIALIDDADYQNRVAQAEAELAAANAQADAADAQAKIALSTSKGGLSSAKAALSGSTASVAGADAQIAAAQASVEKAQADASRADNDLKRAQQLRKDDAIPQAQVDSLSSAAAASHAAVAQAQAQLAAAREAKSGAQTRIAEAAGRVEQSAPVDAQNAAAAANAALAHARAKSAEAALAQAKLQLSYTKIVAPFDGHISKLGVHVGQLVAPSQVITNVLPASTYIVANFKETQVGQMRAGQTATVSVDALPGRTLHAKVESISYGTGAEFSLLPPDNASGNFVKVVQRVPVKLTWVDLPADAALQAGLSVDVTVDTR
jgi:membrane fusion protein (multidrug efflux system)